MPGPKPPTQAPPPVRVQAPTQAPTQAPIHAPTPAPTLLVWPWAVRLGHWALAGAVLGCLLLHEGGPWHERLGYAALALAGWRVGLGLMPRVGPRIGPRVGADATHLRFAAFVHGWRRTWAYARALGSRTEPRHLGHNPLGGWMIVALLGAALLAGGSGALYATDRFWGDPLLYRLHQLAGWAFAGLVPLHLAGVALTSLLQRENLVRAMLTGRKRAAAPGDTGLD